MKPSEFAKNQLEFLIRRKALSGAISSEQENDLMLAEAYLRLREAAEWHVERGYLRCDCGENQYRSCDGCKLLLALEGDYETE
jgi:hypothetical protein